MIRFHRALLLLTFIIFHQTLRADGKDTLRVLFVGNSYTYYYNLIQMVSLISDSTDTKLICTKSTVGGTNLREHWNSEKGLTSKELISKNKYDIVVLQDHSLRGIEQPDSLVYYGNLFCGLIKSRGATPLFYNTWARKKAPESQALINKAYTEAAGKCGTKIAKVGDCWQEAMRRNPSLELFSSDGSHPSHLGTFLAALTFVKTITGKLPDQLPTVFNYIDKDGETFRIMQVTPDEIRLFKEIVEKLSDAQSG